MESVVYSKRHVQKASSQQKRKVVNVRAAKHRYESFSKPMGRQCIYFGPIISAALEVIHTRKPQQISKYISRWLSGLSNEVCALAAMMSDGADEHLLFTRKVDREQYDAGLLNLHCREFLHKLDFMLGERKGVGKPQVSNLSC